MDNNRGGGNGREVGRAGGGLGWEERQKNVLEQQ